MMYWLTLHTININLTSTHFVYWKTKSWPLKNEQLISLLRENSSLRRITRWKVSNRRRDLQITRFGGETSNGEYFSYELATGDKTGLSLMSSLLGCGVGKPEV